jgi:peptidoglycan/xylan/chitin deacetylase (PgdA/CDA1 family)
MALTRREFLKAGGLAALSLPFLRIAGARAGEVPVLLYHDISDSYAGPYTVPPALFAAQMEWLFSEGCRVVTLREAGRLRGNAPGKTVVVTFDDGYASFLDYAFPLLEAYGFSATINIAGAAAGRYWEMAPGVNRPMLSWDEYRHLAASGLVELGCHSYDLHRPGGVMAATPGALREDLARFQDRITGETGRRAEVLAWPFGIYDEHSVIEAKRAGFRYLLTSREGLWTGGSRTDEIPRLNIGGPLDLASFRQYIGEAS